MDWTADVVFWHWWVVAVVFLVVELLRPSHVFLWLGFAAAAEGFLLLVFPSTPVGAQLVVFGLLVVLSVVAWRRYRRDHPAGSA